MLFLIYVFSFATICLLTIGLTMRGERAVLRDRVEGLRLQMAQDVEMVVPELSQPFGERVIKPWLTKMASLASGVVPANAMGGISAKLQRAGSPWKLKPLEFIGLKVISFVVLMAVGIALAYFVEMTPIYRVLSVVVAAVVGYAVPDSLLERAIRERQRIIRKSLADSLDLLVVSAEAGLGFDGALAKVVEKVRGPLADEFKRALEDMSVGRSRMEALRSMSGRLEMPEITTFVAAIHQADLLGVSIAHVLRVQADNSRMQRNLRAREAAAKLPVKMLFPLVFCIFPAIFIVLLGPGVIEIFKALSNVGR